MSLGLRSAAPRCALRSLALGPRSLGGVAALAVLAFAPGDARANPWDLYGFNPRALAMAGSQTAAAEDFTAAYYNPASLTRATNAGFGVGFMAFRPALSLSFERGDRAIAEAEVPSSNGVTFGAIFPLGGQRARNRVALGLGINVPTRSILNGQALDPAVPNWYMYQSLPSRIVTVAALGILPFDWLAIGGGVQVLAGVTGSLDYELDIVSGRFSKKNVVFDIEPQTAPLFGLELRPLKGLRIGASYRAEVESPIGLPVKLQITGVATLDIQTSFRVQYTPHQLSLGASYDLDDLGLLLSADATYAMWSRAPDPSVSSQLDAGGELFEGTGIGGAFDAPAPGQERAVVLAFRDIVTTRLGVEKKLGAFTLRAGYALKPSPAPLQTSGTNYVDATTHQLSLGGGVRFRDPLDMVQNPLIVDLGASVFFVPKRHYAKVDPSDPVGPYDASGAIFVVGLALRYEFQEAEAESTQGAVDVRPRASRPPRGADTDAGDGRDGGSK